MIYLDHGATSMGKPPQVGHAMVRALQVCGNPGRGGHAAAMAGAEVVYSCREEAAKLFACRPEQVALTASCTHGLNIAIRTLVRPGSRVVISGFEHNAVVRPLHALGAQVVVAGRRLFDSDDLVAAFEKALPGADAAVFTHVSNVFGFILPVERLAELCHSHGVPFVVDGAQSAGMLPLELESLEADFIAAPGHKGLLGPQGTGILLCNRLPQPLLYGGTGTDSRSREMPQFLPERLEAGTVNVPGIAGLREGIREVRRLGLATIAKRQQKAARLCAQGLQEMGVQVFAGREQGGTVSFLPSGDCEDFAQRLAQQGIAVRAGLHCAPLAHESAGTLERGTVRVSFGHDAAPWQAEALLRAVKVAEVM